MEMPFMGTCRFSSLQRLQSRKSLGVAFCYSDQAGEKQRLDAMMKHQQKQARRSTTEGGGWDGTSLSPAQTPIRLQDLQKALHFSLSSLWVLSPSLLSAHCMSSATFSTWAGASLLRQVTVPFQCSLLNLLFLLAKYPWKRIGECCAKLPDLASSLCWHLAL